MLKRYRTKTAPVEGRGALTGSSIVKRSKLKLHLGCGAHPFKGFVNCDRWRVTGATDVVLDLEQPWPFRTGSVNEILIVHTLEHLQDYKFFFREAWRVLEEWGNLEIILPHGNHDSAFCDVDHQKVYYPASFLFAEPGYAKSIANPDYLQWKWFFGVKYVECKWTKGWQRFYRWPLQLFLIFLHNKLGLFGMCEEMWIHMTALKTLYTADWWVQTRSRPANCCPILFVNEFTNEKGEPRV